MTSHMRSMLALFVLLLVAVPVGAAHAGAPGMRFTVRPAEGGSLSRGGDYFVIGATPGSTAHQALELANPTSRPVTVRLAPVDGWTAQMGGVDYSPSGLPPEKTGAWIDLSEDRVRLEPGTVETVPFDVVVPSNARTGTNLGGIAVWSPAPEAGPRDGQAATAAVAVQTRRVVAVEIDLPGHRDPSLEIQGVSAMARPDGVYLQIEIRNDGHDYAQGEGTIDLEASGFSRSFPLDKVVPATTVRYPIKWGDVTPAAGAYHASVEIDYGTGIAAWDGDVIVGDVLQRDLADRGVAGKGSFPLAGLVAGIAVLGGTVGAAWWRRRLGRSVDDA